jgi:hypothetical protein
LATESSVVFLFDENSPRRLARALRENLGENAYHVYDVLHPSAPDEMVLRHAGERGWCMISWDRRILRRPHERAVLTDMGMGAFFVKETITDFCRIVRTVIRHWPEMKRIARTQARQFIYLVTENGVKPMPKRNLG